MLLLASNAIAQSHLQWTTTEVTPGSQTNLLTAAATDKDGNTYTSNFTQSNTNFYMTYRFFMYDKHGIKKWQYDNDSCFTNCNDKYFNIIPMDNGALFIGYYEDINSLWQIRMKRIDSTGNLLWLNYWNVPYAAAFPVKALTDNSGAIVVGLKSIVTNQTQEDFAFAKFDSSNGSLIWNFELPDGGSSGNELSEIISDFTIDAANNIYGCGLSGNGFTGVANNEYFKVSDAGALQYRFIVNDQSTISPFNGNGVRQIKTGTNDALFLLLATGTHSRVQRYAASTGAFDYTVDMMHDTDNTSPAGFVVTDDVYVLSNYNRFIPDTTFQGGHSTNFDYMITKLTTAGSVVWQQSYFEDFDTLAIQNGLGGASQLGYCNGNLYTTAVFTIDSNSIYNTSILSKLDTTGTILWYDTLSTDYGAGVMTFDNSCNIYLSRSQNLGANYLSAITQKFVDYIVASGMNENKENGFSIYPNPASSIINISLKQQSDFKLALYNTNGQKLVENKNQKTIDVSDFKSGIYLMRIQQGAAYFQQKFIKQ